MQCIKKDILILWTIYSKYLAFLIVDLLSLKYIKEQSSVIIFYLFVINAAMFLLMFFQKSCIDFTIQARPFERYMPKERNSIKYKIWRIVVSTPFEYFIMILIVLNTLLLMMKVSVTIVGFSPSGTSVYQIEILLIRLLMFSPDSLRSSKLEWRKKCLGRKQKLCKSRFAEVPLRI